MHHESRAALSGGLKIRDVQIQVVVFNGAPSHGGTRRQCREGLRDL
jgi:hypothetical protein